MWGVVMLRYRHEHMHRGGVQRGHTPAQSDGFWSDEERRQATRCLSERVLLLGCHLCLNLPSTRASDHVVPGELVGGADETLRVELGRTPTIRVQGLELRQLRHDRGRGQHAGLE